MALPEGFQLIIQDPVKLVAMSEATAEKLNQFTPARLGENLKGVERGLLG